MDTLSQEQINGAFHALGLSTIYLVITQSPPIPLSAHPSCQPLMIQAFAVSIYDSSLLFLNFSLLFWDSVLSSGFLRFSVALLRHHKDDFVVTFFASFT